MKRIEVTIEQVQNQLEQDTQMEKETADIFYSLRRVQAEGIIKKGRGIFSTFRNEEVEVVIVKEAQG